tara:strand:+ start:231 stop:356 length:126 start_codon:yes stop_codon:yes gene_type:complete
MTGMQWDSYRDSEAANPRVEGKRIPKPSVQKTDFSAFELPG